ncbi:hypothetical protein ACET3Z_000806 [Daucus carota]
MDGGPRQIDGKTPPEDASAPRLAVAAQRAFCGLHPGSGGVLRGGEAELVAAGWPSWMVRDDGGAFRGWVPRKEHSFHFTEKIGEGEYNTVYRALDIEQRKIVALKKIKFNYLEAGNIRFMAREINILRLASRPCLKFTEPQIKCYMKQLLCGCHYCHGQGILHRDVKGSNLLLDHNGQ